MRYAELEDLTGSIEVLVFPGQVRKFDTLVQPDTFVAVYGNLDMAEDAPPKLRLENVVPLLAAAGRNTPTATKGSKPAAKLYLRMNSAQQERVDAVKAILKNANGDVPVILCYEDTRQNLKAPPGMQIRLGDGRLEQLTDLLHKENVRLVEI